MSVGNQSFSNCASLKSIDFSSNLAQINESAFSNCSSLTTIELPGSISSIGSKAFNGCTSLESVSYLSCHEPGKCDGDAFEGSDSLVLIRVPESYNSSTFCGKNITDRPYKHDSQCYDIDNNCIFSKKPSVVAWETQSNGCIEYVCADESGLKAIIKCNNGGNVVSCHDDGECMDEELLKDKLWRVILELEKNSTSTGTYEEVLSELRGIISDVSISVEYNDEGQMIRITAYIDNESQAVKIKTVIDECKSEGNCEGIIRNVREVHIREVTPELPLSKGCHNQEAILSTILMITSLTFLFH